MRKLIPLFLILMAFLCQGSVVFIGGSTPSASSAGPTYTGTGANYNDGGTTAWTNPTNIQGDTTGTAATCNIGVALGTSQRIRASNFGFEIPEGATINGVLVEVERFAANNNRHRWNSVRLLKAGTESGDNRSDASIITNTKTFKSFGSASDLWGNALTYSDVNASGFGVSFKIERYGNATTTSLYRCRITVYYTT